MSELNVGLRDLKTHLSEYMRQVKSGRTIVITEHGRAVGRLVPAAKSVEPEILFSILPCLSTDAARKLVPPRSTPME